MNTQPRNTSIVEYTIDGETFYRASFTEPHPWHLGDFANQDEAWHAANAKCQELGVQLGDVEYRAATRDELDGERYRYQQLEKFLDGLDLHGEGPTDAA